MAVRSETLQVSGIRCERCVQRLGAALQGHDGLEFANANLMGTVTLSWDEERTDLEALLAAMANGGLPPAPTGLGGSIGLTSIRPARDDRQSPPPPPRLPLPRSPT